MNPTDTSVEMGSAADRPAFSDRGDSVVEQPEPTRQRSAAATVAAMTDEELMAEAGVEPVFSTTEAAEFFDRSNQWLYWGLREGVFTDDDGNPLDPDRIGDSSKGRRRFTIPVIENIMRSSYRRGNIDPDHLKLIVRRLHYAKLGVEWREREGWRYVHLGRNRYRWMHPDDCEWDSRKKEWKARPEAKVAHD
jgi:hypothetical protein